MPDDEVGIPEDKEFNLDDSLEDDEEIVDPDALDEEGEEETDEF